jgi:cell division protease FtsH
MDVNEKRFALFAACGVAGLAILGGVNILQARTAAPHADAISYSRFLDDLDRGQVRSVTLSGQRIAGSLAGRQVFRTYAADDPDLIRTLRSKGVAITAEAPPAAAPSWLALLATLLPTLLFIGVMTVLMRRTPSLGGGAGLGKSKARLLTQAGGRVTFQDVAGVDEAKASLQEIVDFLREPAKFQALGGRIPRGVLLVGPPGTGKTLLARAVAGEADAPFFTISGSDFVEMFVGVGASRVRAMFEQAKKHAPCIIFMDEIDAVGRRRGAGLGGGNDEREQTLNQLLVEMDGFENHESVILIAATNRPDVLDPALLRPGRFDREVVIDHPSVLGREQILAVHVRKVPLVADVDLERVARATPGFSGADLMNLVNEAALLAVRRERAAVGVAEFEDARDTVTMGAERTTLLSEADRRLTAYREGGRAIVALHAPAADPVHKATIVTRGRSTGMVKQLPEADQIALTLEQLTSRLTILMAGRAAEAMVFGRSKITSGAGADIAQATKLARSMVTRWGLSDALGPVAYGEDEDEVFLGYSVGRRDTESTAVADLIAAEVRRLIDAALADATAILMEHHAGLERLAQALLANETLSGEEIRAVLAEQAAV